MNMPRTFIFFSLLCLTTCKSYGQIQKQLRGDTTFWYSFESKKFEKLKLPELISSTDKFHFRFWADGQAVDIWTVDGVTFRGMVTSYTSSYQENVSTKKPEKDPQTFSKQVDLDTTTARKAFNLTRQIEAIPTDKLIKNWVQGLDGIEYVIETSTPAIYSFKTYWTPSVQDFSLAEAKKIKSFVKNLDSLLDLGHKYHQFFATLKPGNYYTGDGTMVAMKLTAEQNEYSKRTKPYRDYLESVRDTLNHYLSDTLTKIFARYGDIKCYDDFVLKFSRGNRLIKITTKEKLTDEEDRREFRACKKKIEAAFEQIKIDFVHSQVTYWKELDYSEGQVSILEHNTVDF